MLLVTGITGHSGHYFLKELIENRYEGPVRCIVREKSDTTLIDTCGLNIEKVVGDLADQKFVDQALVGIDTVMHIASIFHSPVVMRAAIRNGVKRAILVHTTGIYSRFKSASNEYKRIEASIKDMITESKSSISLIYLRPTMIYGNINDRNMIVFIRMVNRLRLLPIVAGGKSLLQPVNGRDLGKAYYQVLTTPGLLAGDYILSGERPVSMRNMFELIGETLGKKVTFISFPMSLSVFMAVLLKACTFGKVDFVEKVQRMGEDRSFPHQKAAMDFGYQPMSFKEGLRAEVRQYLETQNRSDEGRGK